jgi:hypothetical protein
MMEFVNGKDDIPYMKWKIKHVRNQQPDEFDGKQMWCEPIEPIELDVEPTKIEMGNSTGGLGDVSVGDLGSKKPDTVVERQPYGSKTIHIIWVQQWGRHPQPLVFLLQISGTYHSCSAALFMDLEVLVGDTFTWRYH